MNLARTRWNRSTGRARPRTRRSAISCTGSARPEVERVFREHAANLNCAPVGANARVVAFDGKTLKGSFDSFNDIRARQVLSAFAVDTGLVLAHIEIDEKSNEIPAMQKLLQELGLAGHIATADAIHCQKNI